MQVYLVQHGKAKSKEEDPDRPLTEEGRAEATAVAFRLAERNAAPASVILHSGKARARQTAEIFAAHLAPPEGVRQADELEPLADPSVWRERLDEEQRNLMLVGHLPHLAKLSAGLLGLGEDETPIEFTNAGAACLRLGDDGGWAVRWLLVPELAG